MCASVEMLLKFCAEKFVSERTMRELRGKNAAMHKLRNFFNGANLPLASTALYIWLEFAFSDSVSL